MWIGLFLVFVAVPLLELALLIKLGQVIGFWSTIAIVVITACVGTAILHHQGFAAFRRATDSINQGQPPIEPVLDGIMLMLAGTLLIAPGLITDCAGLLLLIPRLRKALARWGLRRLLAKGTIYTSGHTSTERHTKWQGGNHPSDSHAGANPTKPRSSTPGTVIDGEFERIDEKTQDPSRADRPQTRPYRNGHAKDP